MKSLYLKLWYCPDICQEVMRKAAKNISTVSVPPEIREENLSNTSL